MSWLKFTQAPGPLLPLYRLGIISLNPRFLLDWNSDSSVLFYSHYLSFSSHLLGYCGVFSFQIVTFPTQLHFPGKVRALAHPFLSLCFWSRQKVRPFHVQDNVSSSLQVWLSGTHSCWQAASAYNLCYQLPFSTGSTPLHAVTLHCCHRTAAEMLDTVTWKKFLWKAEGSCQAGIGGQAPPLCPVSFLGD